MSGRKIEAAGRVWFITPHACLRMRQREWEDCHLVSLLELVSHKHCKAQKYRLGPFGIVVQKQRVITVTGNPTQGSN